MQNVGIAMLVYINASTQMIRGLSIQNGDPLVIFLLQKKGPDFIHLVLSLHLNSSHRLQTTSYGRFNSVSHTRR